MVRTFFLLNYLYIRQKTVQGRIQVEYGTNTDIDTAATTLQKGPQIKLKNHKDPHGPSSSTRPWSSESSGRSRRRRQIRRFQGRTTAQEKLRATCVEEPQHELARRS